MEQEKDERKEDTTEDRKMRASLVGDRLKNLRNLPSRQLEKMYIARFE